MASSSDDRVRLRVAEKKAYVWDVDDITKIRSEYRLCGTLTGTLPHVSQQNVFLGIPLVLMPEEVVLLVENELAVLVDDPNAHLNPSSHELRRWIEERKESINQQQALLEAKSGQANATPARALSEEAIKKRKARESKRAADAAKAAQDAASDGPSLLLVPDEPPTSSTTLSTSQYTVIVPASSDHLEWYVPESCKYTTIAAAKAAGVWDYPSSLLERARCGVFQSLWEQQYFMGGGIKFGADYLVYPGDPLRYHSHFAATVLESPTSSLQPMEIVAHGRLGTATKKAHLLCGWDDEKKEVSYLSIEWAGFG